MTPLVVGLFAILAIVGADILRIRRRMRKQEERMRQVCESVYASGVRTPDRA